MGIDFRGIRGRLQWRRKLLSLKARRAALGVLQRGLIMLSEHDKTIVAETEAHNQEWAARQQALEREALFSAVGIALSFWAQMEENLVAITGMLLRTNFSMAGLIMYSIINFHVRLNIIDELFSMSPHYASLKSKWNKIASNLREMQDTRDRLAHHTVYSEATSEGDASLKPGRLDTRHKSKAHLPLDRNQIMTFTDSVAKVTTDTANLITAMVELDASREKSSE